MTPSERPLAVPARSAVVKLAAWSVLGMFLYLLAFAKLHPDVHTDLLSAGGAMIGAAVLASLLAHELLHAAGFLLAGVPASEIRFGIERRTLSPYAHTPAQMPARGYRLALMAPGVILGVLPAAAGLITGSNLLAALGMFQLIGATGDMYVLWLMRKLPADALVCDHPTLLGCELAHNPGRSAPDMTQT